MELLFLIISYGAFLLLLLKASKTVLMFIVAVFILGSILIINKKYCARRSSEKNKRYFLIPVAILLDAYFGSFFYKTWLLYPKMQVIANILHMSSSTILMIVAIALTISATYCTYLFLRTIFNYLCDSGSQNSLFRSVLSCVIASAVTVILSQVMIGVEVLLMGFFNFTVSVLIISVIILVIFCLIGKIIPSIALGTGLFMIVSTVNVYVYQFRGRLFEPSDIVSASTAINVAENYSLLPIPSVIIIGWGIYFAMLILFCCIKHEEKSRFTSKKRIAILASCIVISFAIVFYISTIKIYHWDKEGAVFNGYVIDFVSKLKEIYLLEPDNYDIETIEDLAQQYGSHEDIDETGKRPNIIVIMDESFADLSLIGELSTNLEVMPFISSLKENTISGYTLVSVYGGNTANSEYEFLTGNSFAWLSPSAVPFQLYIRSSAYSMVSWLKSSYDYKCVAMHPFYSNGWNRPVAYNYLGFDECYFIEDFPQEKFIREYISDQEMFEFLIETYETENNNPLFIFGVTMQNHGDYTYNGDNYYQSISLNNNNKFPEVEQYLTLVHETDKAVESLITYFESVDEDVVIVFFGDHQPKIDNAFYEEISGISAITLNEQQKRYEVPFFIWANYDIKEKTINNSSLNYLSSYVYEVAGISLPPYNQFLSEMEEIIPAINTNGFYSIKSGKYLHFDEADENEAMWLTLYESLQYNNIFDNKHHNMILFPLLD